MGRVQNNLDEFTIFAKKSIVQLKLMKKQLQSYKGVKNVAISNYSKFFT